MTMPHERLRALEMAGDLLREIASSKERHLELFGEELPTELIRQAHVVLRHFPTHARLVQQAPLPSLGQWIDLDP